MRIQPHTPSFFFCDVNLTCVIHCSIRYLDPNSLLSSAPLTGAPSAKTEDVPPEGTVKSILPCTPLGIVKCLENIGVYNRILPYGDRAYGKTVTVINRYARSPSEGNKPQANK